jgi:hypothetical protein
MIRIVERDFSEVIKVDMKETMFESMLKFIHEHQEKEQRYLVDKYPKIQQVLSIKAKDSDDDNGASGSKYIVKCQMLHLVNTGTSRAAGVFEQYEATCLVDVQEFDNYRKKRNSIIWL